MQTKLATFSNFQASIPEERISESSKKTSGICDIISKIWNKILSCLRVIFCCRQESKSPVDRIFPDYNAPLGISRDPPFPTSVPSSSKPQPKTSSSKPQINSFQRRTQTKYYIVEEPGEEPYRVEIETQQTIPPSFPAPTTTPLKKTEDSKGRFFKSYLYHYSWMKNLDVKNFT